MPIKIVPIFFFKSPLLGPALPVTDIAMLLLNKSLTFYFQDMSGESHSKFKKFSKNWWLRRKQAHDFMILVNKKYKVSLKTKSDFFATNIIGKFYNFL